MDYNVLASWVKMPSSIEDDSLFIGGKARGLLKLPTEWTPKFIILSREFYERWKNENNTLKVLTSLPTTEQNVIAQFLQTSISGFNPAQIIVRSNSPEEHDITHRGRFLSEIVKPKLQTIANAIDKIFMDASPTPVFIILQGYIPGIQGHISNERRVSPKRTTWFVETHEPLQGLPEDARLTISKSNSISPLYANTHLDLLKALRRVAGRLAQTGMGYYHCEWVWSGQRLWIVQSDEAYLPQKDLYVNNYIRSKDKPNNKFIPKSPNLIHFDKAETGKWKKLQRTIEFEKLGLPTGDIYLLTGDSWKNESIENNQDFQSDLSKICDSPVVVRCDLASNQINKDDVLLPTSDPIADSRLLTDFITQQSEKFIKAGIAPTNFAFLLASLVSARASAWVQAYPNGEQVIIDSLWGFPDGLLFLPHDTVIYNASKKTIQKTIRYKGLGLFTQNNKWHYRKIGAPHDWLPVLRDDEISTLAKWGLKLAKALDSEVQLMCLARIGGHRGSNACLPWHYTNLSLIHYNQAKRNVLDYKNIKIISSEVDLHKLSKNVPSQVKGFLIKPTADLRRNENFIRRVAKLAAENNRPLLFEGSILSHPYYIMTKEGAQVVPITSETAQATKISYEKLVRDKIPEVVRKAGVLPVFYMLNKTEAIRLLKRKLIEESFEVWESIDKEALAEELADVLEVIESLRVNASIDFDELKKLQEKKKVKRGGFENLVYLKETVIKSPKAIEVQNRSLPEFEADLPHKITGIHEVSHEYLDFIENNLPNIITEFSIPLVPPINDRKPVFGSSGKGIKVVCYYENGRLKVSVFKIENTPNSSVKQLEIFSECSFESEETVNKQRSLFPEDNIDNK
jgi:predicted house-cleaning noncanonical NTP pyrophosphatase (MazG superfamily)